MSEGELFDFMRERFGVGDFCEGITKVPYWRWRNVEVSKIKSMLKRRRTSVAEMKLAADYAIESGIAIKTPFDVLLLITDAKRAQRKATPASRVSGRARLTQAAAEAAERGDMALAQQLMAADDREA